MSISALPSHILFDIILGIVAGYVDTAIASPPAPRWMHRFSKPAIILVRDFLATQIKNGLREPPHVAFASNLTEWSNVTESEFLDILRELVGEEELDSFLLPEIPSNFDFVAWDEEEFEKDQIPDAIVAEDHKSDDESSVPSLESTTENKESANFCEVAEEGDSLVLSGNSLLAEETKETNELAEDAVNASGGNELQSHSPVPSESLTVLGSPDENTAEIDEISSTADEDASDGEVGSDTDGDWVEEWFEEWFAVEEREPLTKNTIVHLMGVNGAFREATLKAINLTLGIKRGRKKILNKRMTAVLRDLRMRYRLALTQELRYHVKHGIEAYSGPKTPLVDTYLALISGGYLLRCLQQIETFQESRKSPALNTHQMIQRMKTILPITARLSPAPLRNRILQRAYIFHVRLEKYLALMLQFTKVNDAYNSVKTGQEPDAPIHLYNCPRLKNAVQELALWDEFSVDIAVFPILPRLLIEASLIRPQLQDIVKLQEIEKLRANEDLMVAVHIARGLLEKWCRRIKAWPDFYVVLD